MDLLSRLMPDFETPAHDQGNWLIIKSPLFCAEYKWHEKAVELDLDDHDEIFSRALRMSRAIEGLR